MFKYEMTATKKLVQFAGFTWTQYRRLNCVDDALSVMEVPTSFKDENGKYLPFTETRIMCYRWFTQQYGVTPSKFVKLFNWAMLKAFPVPDWAKFAVLIWQNGRSKISELLVNRFFANEPAVLQAHEDGLDNLIPLIMWYNADPAAIKKIVGKGAWKRLANNSKSRNTLLAAKALICMQPPHALNILPTTILSKLWLYNADPRIIKIVADVSPSYKAAAHAIKTSAIVHIIADTIRMAEELGSKIPIYKTVEDWERKHNELYKIVKARSFSTEPYAFLEPHEVTGGGFTAALLRSPFDIAYEGEVMHHCVASYERKVAAGHYRVYAVSKNGKRYATLGIKTLPGRYPTVDQCYGPCNTLVEMAGFPMATLLAQIQQTHYHQHHHQLEMCDDLPF